jgi:hypothetical protein
VVFGTAITVLSVAKSYSNRGNHRHRPGTKKRWYLYYIDEDGTFKTRRINALEALYYKGKKVHRYRIICPYCDGPSLLHSRSLKGEAECPYCSEMIDLEDLDDDSVDVFKDDEEYSQL